MKETGKDLKIEINSATICYDDLGAGELPIVFIHGFPFDKSAWQPQMHFFKDTHRIIAYDIRGFGNSTTNENSMSIGLFADDLIHFLDVLEIKKAIVCGLSMGGYILLNAVTRYPDRFEALVLCDTQCIADSDEAKEKRAQTILQINSGKLKDFATSFVGNIFCQETLDRKQEIVLQIKNTILSTSELTIVNTLQALAGRAETCSALHEINVPTLIICGNEDKVTPVKQAEFLHDNIANSELHIVQGAGHMSNLEQADSFNEHLQSFITSVVQ